MARDIKYNDVKKQKAHDAVDLDAMQQELNLTSSAAQKLQSPVVWSHNDLLSGNVLVTHQANHHLHSMCDFETFQCRGSMTAAAWIVAHVLRFKEEKDENLSEAIWLASWIDMH